MDQDMPQLLQVLEHILVGSPLPPVSWVEPQRSLSGADGSDVYDAVARDSSRKPWDGGAPEFPRYVVHRKSEPTMPVEQDRMFSTERLEGGTGWRSRKRRVGN